MKLATALVLAFATAAFAPQQPAPAARQAADPAQQEQKAENPPASAAKATLYVYRLRDLNRMLRKPSVYIDERELARIENGRFFGVNVDPGRHVVRSTKASAVTLEMKPGQVYYIRVAYEFSTGSLATTLVRPEQGWSEIGQTKANNPKDIKDQELAFVDSMPSKPASGPAFAQQGETLGSQELQRDTLMNITIVDRGMAPDCKAERRVLKMEITKQPMGLKVKRNRMVAGEWEERWTIDRCGLQVAYDVTYRADGRGGTDIGSRMAKVLEQEKKTDTAAQPPVSSQAGTADALPEGFVLYQGHKSQFTIALPPGWIAFDDWAHFNLIFFYLPPKPTSQGAMTQEVIEKIHTGEIPSFFVAKSPAENGMSCAGFSEKAEKAVFELVTGDATFGEKATILEAPRSEPSPVAGCKGVRIRETGQPVEENTPWMVDVYAASDGKTLYQFTLYNYADNYKKNAEVFQKAVATARLTAAK
jgi:hypothetical protein